MYFPYSTYIAPNSSSIAHLFYNKDTNELAIGFHKNHGYYVYEDVSNDLFNELINSYSVGNYYARFIKGEYASAFYNGDAMTFEKIEDKPVVEAVNIVNNVYSIKNGEPIDLDQPLSGVLGNLSSQTVVTLEIGGKVREYKTNTSDVATIFSEIENIADMLAVIIKIKEITIKYV